MADHSSSPVRFSPLAGVVVLIVLLRLADLLPSELRLWGVDFHRHLDMGWLLIMLAVPVSMNLAAFLLRGANTDARRPTRWLWGTILLLLLAVALWPMETFYYGDGGPLIAEVYKIGAREHYASEMLRNLHSAPLAGGLLHLLAEMIPSVMHALGLTLPATPLFPFLALGLLGAPVLGAVMSIEKNPRLRLPILLLLLGSGAVILFFRYAEMYLPVFLAVTAYLLAASAALRRERPVWLAALLYAIAVAAHYMALALLPSLLFLFLRDRTIMRRCTGTPRALAWSFAGMLAGAFALYFLLGFHHSDSRVVMPLLAVDTPAGTLTYTLLSAYHLADLVNALLLLGPIPVLLLPSTMLAGWLAGRKRGSAAGPTGGPARQAADGDPLRFQLIAGFSFLLFLFFANTSLGLARDWDIAAPLAAILVMILVEMHRGGTKRPERDPAVDTLLRAGLAAVLLVVPWIAVNVNVAASTARFESILHLDDEHMYGDYALSGYEALRKQALHDGDRHREGEILKRMIEIVGYPEQYRLLLINAVEGADTEPRRYLALHDWMLARLADRADALRTRGVERDYGITRTQIDSLAAVMAIESVTRGHSREMQPRLERFAQRSGCVTGVKVLTGTERYSGQQYEEGIPIFEAIRAAGFRDPRVDGMYGSCLYIAGDRARGDAELTDGLRRYGKNPQYLFMTATAYLQRDGRFDEARALLERALTLDPPDDARAQITGLIEQLRAYIETSTPDTEPSAP